MVEKGSIKINAYSKSKRWVEKIGEILREHFPVVVNTGLAQNNRDPYLGEWRGYFTIVVEDDDDE